nr:hypothetical protein SHINE37_43266 [Rhizobiaceae bacterium]
MQHAGHGTGRLQVRRLSARRPAAVLPHRAGQRARAALRLAGAIGRTDFFLTCRAEYGLTQPNGRPFPAAYPAQNRALPP